MDSTSSSSLARNCSLCEIVSPMILVLVDPEAYCSTAAADAVRAWTHRKRRSSGQPPAERACMAGKCGAPGAYLTSDVARSGDWKDLVGFHTPKISKDSPHDSPTCKEEFCQGGSTGKSPWEHAIASEFAWFTCIPMKHGECDLFLKKSPFQETT